MKAEYAKLEMELAAYGACDPVKIEEKRRAIVLAKEAAVRWTGKYEVASCPLPPYSSIRTQITISSCFRTSRVRTAPRWRM